jgi:hypothetical protein
MEDSLTATTCLDEAFRGVVRIRLYEYDTDVGRRQAIELTAWNSWAGQAKLISFSGGLDPAAARAAFDAASRDIETYSWMEGGLVFGDQ